MARGGGTDLPFTFGKVLLDLSADRFVDVLVQSGVSGDPETSAGHQPLIGGDQGDSGVTDKSDF